MNYRFSVVDYVVLILSYLFFGLFVADLQGVIAFVLPLDVPSWIYLVIAGGLNLWIIPIPGIHPRTPPMITGETSAAMQLAPPEGAPHVARPSKPARERVPSSGERLAKGLSKTHKGFIERISTVFRQSTTLDEEVLTHLEETLVGTDIGVKTAYRLFEDIQGKAGSMDGPEAAMAFIKQEIEGILATREEQLVLPVGIKPFVIMVTGVNGSGKTTTIAKIARRLINDGKSVIVAAGDTFRAAAIEQLEHWATKVGADFVRSQEGADPSSVAYDGLQAAIARGHDVLIIDTAGRLHTKENIMEELKKTKRVLNKQQDGTPHEVLLVLDATLGQNALEQTRQFNAALGVTGIVLTKLDGTAKGGVIVGIANEFEIPIRFIGIGEDMDDLQPFTAQDFTNALFLDN